MTWQPPQVVFPDTELVLCEQLRAALGTRTEPYATEVYVGNTTPNPRRPRMVTVRRDGGPRVEGLLEAAQVGVNVWADTEQNVNDLARLVRGLLWVLPAGLWAADQPICRVDDISGPVAIADDSGQPLRYLTFEITLRGEPLAV